jgi:hypothetical protein
LELTSLICIFLKDPPLGAFEGSKPTTHKTICP